MGQFFQMFVCGFLRRSAEAWSRFVVPALCAFLLLFSANCALTIDDLKSDNPRADVYAICDTPTEIHDDVKLFMVKWSTGELVTDEDEQKLRYAAYRADAFCMVSKLIVHSHI